MNRTRQIIAICILFITFFYSRIAAQVPKYYNSAEIFQHLKKLNVLGSVLYIAAHPDDENTRLLAYLANEKLYRTAYLSLTRGDGGQNLIGDEQGVELGLIRTQELLSARRIDGAEQFFTTAFDFGYCKTAGEAIDTWGHQEVLADMVWLIRQYQPDIILTRFPGDERAGHGHHQASNILAVEAFIQAADSSKFPEQFQYGVKPWKAKRIMWNTFNFGNNNTTSDQQFKIDVGLFNPLLGKGYGELASESRSQHKSQGFGVPRQRGSQAEYFTHLLGDSLSDDLMNDVNTGWQRIEAPQITNKVDRIINDYSFEHPERSVSALTALYREIAQLKPSYWQEKKLEEIKEIILQCSGLLMEATTNNEYVVPGAEFQTKFFVCQRNRVNTILHGISMRSFDTSFRSEIFQNKNFEITKIFSLPFTEKLSQPYWLENPLSGGRFDVQDQMLIGKAVNNATFEAIFNIEIEGLKLEVKKPVMYKFTDEVQGELYHPFSVVAPLTARLSSDVLLFSDQVEKSFTVSLTARKNYPAFDIKHVIGDNWMVSGNSKVENIHPMHPEDKIFSLTAPGSNDKTVLSISVNDKALKTERNIQYNHIPNIIYYKPAVATVEKIQLKIHGKRIGYITGAGDKVPQALRQMGYDITLLEEKDINTENLVSFDAIVSGIRAYNVHEWLNSKYDILMRYIEEGGTYIVQYNTNNFISSVSSKLGPYPFTISRTRVTDEKAAVRILQPDHRIFHFPNEITPTDFEEWVQERSIYQAEKADNRYDRLLSMNDKGDQASDGSLLVASYGKGHFVYTGLVFFRQLPAGVPGAFRLMANLLALSEVIE
jgi:LmbE family N-acetylglucosaminyl deacetylase